jgi:hypothetical protein
MSWLIVITLAAVGSLTVATFLLWWWMPKWQMRSITAADPKARADIEDNFRKTIGQLVVGAMVLVGAGAGAVIAYLQLSRQQQAAHELLISNQVARGFEQLGNEKSVVMRLGGIYALEGVMNTSEQYHQPVLEALSAFVRDSTTTDTGDGPPATDIQAILTVIGRRKPVFSAEIIRTTPFRTTASGTAAGRAPGPYLDFVHIPKANLVLATLNEGRRFGMNVSPYTRISLNDNRLFSHGVFRYFPKSRKLAKIKRRPRRRLKRARFSPHDPILRISLNDKGLFFHVFFPRRAPILPHAKMRSCPNWQISRVLP